MVTSRAYPQRQAISTLFTTVYTYGVSLAASSYELVGVPGEVVTYTLQVTNLSNREDTFTWMVSGAAWPTTPATLTIGPLAPHATVEQTVAVHIPVNVTAGVQTTFLITVASWGDATQWDAVTLTTKADWLHMFFPLILK
jgi:hypothetical protein